MRLFNRYRYPSMTIIQVSVPKWTALEARSQTLTHLVRSFSLQGLGSNGGKATSWYVSYTLKFIDSLCTCPAFVLSQLLVFPSQLHGESIYTCVFDPIRNTSVVRWICLSPLIPSRRFTASFLPTMRSSSLFFTSAAVITASAQYVGFNAGSTFTDGSAKQQSDFVAEFNRAKSLPGTNGEFTSARLYTMIQGGTTDIPISAIPAAIDTQTTLLLGLWASAGQADFTNELTALTSAISQYNTSFTSLIAGISVGSEDLYRNSPTGILANGYNAGAQPTDIVSFIGQIRAAIAQTPASGLPIGHVDTWTAWVCIALKLIA